MVFNSYAFALYFAALFSIYWLLARWPRAQNLLLLGVSYYFYSRWDARFLSLLILSTLMDYSCGLWVARERDPRRRKPAVALSMALNLGMLAFFKYYDFFAPSLRAALAGAGLPTPAGWLEIALPIGISFYTFQSMSYVIDVYRGEIAPTRNLVQFAAFVSFFPHLVAGPIMRPTTLLPQIQSPRRFELQQFYEGSYLIFWGLIQKVVVADNLAPIVDELFRRWQMLDGGSAMLAVYAFAFQIYGDFSGYTDIARGVSKGLGFELSLNFHLPYFATSPRDFWNRWHISLSRWLRDYLYISLGGSRGGKWFTYRNLAITMALGGLWHGREWTFLLWGLYHGALLIAHRLAEPWLKRIDPIDPVDRGCWKALRIVATFHLICFGWLLFRARSVEQAVGLLSAMVHHPAIPPAAYLVPVLVVVLPLLIIQSIQYSTDDLDMVARTPWYVRSAFYAAGFYAIVLGGNFGGQQFIYFQF